MKTVDYPIIGSFNNQRVPSIDSERTLNLFEYIDPRGKKPSVLIQTSGIANTGLDFSGNNFGFRALFYFNNNMYAVIGNNFYLISQSGTSLSLTLLNPSLPLTTSSGYVGIDANTFQIIIVDGLKGYIWDTNASTFKMITDSSFPSTPIDVCYLDGFFIVAAGGTNNFFLSQFNQGMNWGPANNAVTTNNGVIPNQLIVGPSNIGGPSGTANYATGTAVTLVLGAGGTIPVGLSLTTTYYSIFVDATHIKLATSYANAIAGTAVAFGGDTTNLVNLVSQSQLQEGAITSHPGTIVACKTLHRRLFLFSQFFTEVWENQGIGTNLPFRRNNSFLMEYGTPAVGSVSVGFDKMFFLSQDRDGLGSVMEVVGVESKPVSSRAIDFVFAGFAQLPTTPAGQGVADARGILIKENGIIFYRLNFTTANATFVYNVTMSNPDSEVSMLWHEEAVLNGDRHPAQVHAFFNGSNYYGSYNKAILYLVDVNLTNNDGEAIKRMRIGKPVCPPGYQRLRIDRFQIDLLQGSVQEDLVFEPKNLLTESGLDILTEDGNTLITDQSFATNPNVHPVIFFSYSKDGGQSYGSVSTLPMGNVGQRTFRTLIRKLGTTVRGQAFVPKIEFYNDVPFYLLGASWAYEELPE